MNEINGMDALSRSAIDLAQAAGDLGALKVIFGVFMAMMLFIMVMFVYQTFSTTKRLNRVEEASEKVLAFFNPIGSKSIGKEESKAIIRENITRTATMVKYGILKIRYENNLTAGSADERIAGVVMSEYNNRRAFLGRFLIQGKKLSYVCEEDDNRTLVELMKEYVYMNKEKFTASVMSQEVNYLVDGIKSKYQAKIDELT